MKASFKKNLFFGSFLAALAVYLYPSYCYSIFGACYLIGEPIIRLSISEDGRYVISTDNKGWAVLWDIEHRTKKLVNRTANPYSAYWIKGTQQFSWQDQKTQAVFIQSSDGNTHIFYPEVLSFGNVITSDLRYYVVAGDNCQFYRFDISQNRLVNKTQDDAVCEANPVNFQLASDGKVSLVSQVFDVGLSDLENWKILKMYKGTTGKTFATVSPDGKYVVGGDEQENAFVWDIQKQEPLYALYDLVWGKLVKTTAEDKSPLVMKDSDGYTKWVTTVLHVIPPKDFYQGVSGFMAFKFIDETHYLAFVRSTYYAILYRTLDPSPLKYLDLGKHPRPALSYFQRDQAIDTSWQAHILVMAKENEGGILVYRYDPEKQTLTKIWDAR